MFGKNRVDIISIIQTLALCISIAAIWYAYIRWMVIVRKKAKQELLVLKEQFEAANLEIKNILSFENYFSFRNEQLFIANQLELRHNVPSGFDSVGLQEDLVEAIAHFIQTYDDIKSIRKKYNEDFVKLEAEKFSDFFSSLEEYPLSSDQIEAIIRDEDNNLVLAGAGTGKTTTISAKVAYLLKKGLARPEELLIISFTNNAVKELYARCLSFCREIPNAEKLTALTFNSFGYLVCRKCTSEELHLAFKGEEKKAKIFLQQTFNRLFIGDLEFQKNATNFLAFFNRPERDEFLFQTKDEYIKNEESFKNVTLDGNKMKSKEEMEIGNFFCLHSIKYEYEKHYPLQPEDRSADNASYYPDFYLTDYNIWLEHYGIDRNGDVPPWFNIKHGYSSAKDYYHALIVWKENIHRKYNTKLIKTYSFESKEGRLLSNLKTKLINCGVILEKRQPGEILDMMQGADYYEDFINLIYTFLGLMKANCKSIESIVLKNSNKRIKTFLKIFKPLFEDYEALLRSKSQIDYNDMINNASKFFNEGLFSKPYKYILVDEFQDMSLGRYALLKSVRKQNPDVKLYAVGDDWQSIFRFTGSDLSIITEFEKHFGFTSNSTVLNTYRFNDEILNISSNFIQKNPAQIRKNLTANRSATANSYEFVGLDLGGGNGANQLIKSMTIKSILEEIRMLNENAKVFLIGRYQHNSPENIRFLRAEFSGLTIEYFTAHRVKGMTCDYSILLDLDSGTLGFPSEIADDPILNYLLNEGDSFENAEERRVFYVAITRARHKNYLIHSLTNPSKFIVELMEALGHQEQLSKICPECGGTLLKRIGPFSSFLGCSNYPRCEFKMAIKETKAT